ncbi:MAG TPA: hypothetical protein VN822_09000 [Candidatus Acidoferrales bacterium]|nr:hypothetical protein [Candidatus Acidoferrales bacterium]
MATKKPETHNAPVDRGLGYEPRDANVRALLQFAFWMAVVLAVTMVGMKYTFDYFKKDIPLGPTASPMVKETDRMLPPSPRLQVMPHLELQDYCAAQQREVGTYGWVNQQSGVVRLPVDRAMDLVLARGLPARSASDASAAGSASAIDTPTVAGETDVQGQCGYLTETVAKPKSEEGGEAKQ